MPRAITAPRLLLPGATLRDRLLACLGALAGIIATALVGRALPIAGLPAVVAPVAASAVLVFAVPASPLAQPWPVLGGNVLSALVGIVAVRLLGPGAAVAGIAVAGAILVMSLLRCLHPPGGAAALTAVIGGPAVLAAGAELALLIAANSLVLLAAGWLFHRVSGHSYPHRAGATTAAPRFEAEDLDAALAEAGEAFDIGREDLHRLLAAAQGAADRRRASARARGGKSAR